MQLATARQPQLVTGPEALKAMDRARRLQDQRDQWPYPWLCPPETAQPKPSFGSILCPTTGTLTEVLEYAVPTGLQFALVGVVQLFFGAGYIDGDQDIFWTLDVDAPIGIAAAQGFPLPGMNNIPVPLGTLAGIPWPFQKPFILKQNQVLRSKVFLPANNPLTGAPNGISAGSPNYFVSAFAGFTWPA
jgi:hypothetical protein